MPHVEQQNNGTHIRPSYHGKRKIKVRERKSLKMHLNLRESTKIMENAKSKRVNESHGKSVVINEHQ